jgi:hypothetical protein
MFVIPLFGCPSGEKIQYVAKKNRVIFRILEVTFTPGITNSAMAANQSRKGFHFHTGSSSSLMVALELVMLVVLRAISSMRSMLERGLHRIFVENRRHP